MSTRVRSYCKINLGLAVGPVRADGFHGLTTMYQTIGLHDFVTVTVSRSSETYIWITSNHPAVPQTKNGNAEKNTAWRMVSSALARLRITAEVTIDIQKRLPVQGGLGAGSANAVAALLGLGRELGVALPGPERLRLAAEVGSDVPLFLLGGAVLGLRRGEQVYPLPNFAETWCVVAVPSVGVSTAQAFRELDARMQGTGNREQVAAGCAPGLKPLAEGGGFSGLKAAAPSGWAEAQPLQSIEASAAEAGGGADSIQMPAASRQTVVRQRVLSQAETGPLTYPEPADRLEQLSCAYASVWTTAGVEHGALRGTTGIAPVGGDLAENPLLALVRTGIENDFEEVAFSQHPSLRSTKRDLVGDGYPGDSGCALYAALSGSGSALFGLYRNQADARAAQQRVQTAGTQALLTKTLPRAEYWASMFAE